ncbi:MAG: trypsin-like peptidase domain-containing protein [Clostridiales bacterium]|nr:trypsin-like peptidase domain-containing protein [Clostridiales bacterium]
MDDQDMNMFNGPENMEDQEPVAKDPNGAIEDITAPVEAAPEIEPAAADVIEDQAAEEPFQDATETVPVFDSHRVEKFDMTEDLKDVRYQTVSVPPKQEKKGGSGKWIIILAAALLLMIAYSTIQTVYIYKLNTGSEGIKSYIPGLSGDKKDPDSGETTAQKPEDMRSDPSYEPWFSLEEASADYKDAKRLSTPDIVKTVAPSTVSIDICSVMNGKETATSAGSGFIITKDGYIVTNAHVVEDVKEGNTIKVKVPGVEEKFDAGIIGKDQQTDVAVIKIESDKDLPVVTLGDSDLLESGELVVVIGNALGTLDGTVTAGVVSALDRQIHNDGYTIPVIQTDAAINSGNSGGPMINSYGQVIGITNAKMVTATSEGLGFAIPINKVKTVIESIINYGKVINRPFLGLTLSLIEEGAYYGVDAGVYVTDLIEGGPAVKAGVKIGDKVISFGGVEISVPSDIIGIRDSHSVGDKVDLVILRDGKQETIEFTIGDSGDYTDAGSVSRDQEEIPGQGGFPDQGDPTRPDNGGNPGGLDIFGGTD